MKLSIIIPTLNEEKYIGKLLEDLTKQTFMEFEVIVVDAKSSDRTREKVMEYAKKLDLRFIESPKKGVGFQRNYGADHSSYQDLVFFDADIAIKKDFLEKIVRYLETRHPDVLTSWFDPESDKKRDKIIFRVFNIYLEAIKYISPGGGGAFIYVKKNAFKRIGGFSEEIVLGEDFDLIRRMDKEGYRYQLVRKPSISVSVRRLNKEGRLYYALNLIRAELQTRLNGPIKNNKKIKYEFGNFD